MSIILLIIGFSFFFAGVISLTGLTDAGLQYVTATQLHTLPILRNYPVNVIYTAVGALLLVIAFAIGPARKQDQ